jgi:anti-sigma-K factor RskA
MAAEHERFQEDVGAYLLGALPEDESRAFERHAEVCHVCQDELERLGVAAGALPRAVEQFEPPPSLKRALMEQVYADAPQRERRRRSLAERLGLRGGLARLTPQTAVVATAFVLAVGLLSGYAISQIGAGDSGSRSVAASVDSTRVGTGKATLVLDNDGGGGELRVSSMPQPRAGQVYEIWLQRGDVIEPGPLFSVDSNGDGVGAVPGDLDGVTRVLVTRERRGGARQPTEAPVVSARV